MRECTYCGGTGINLYAELPPRRCPECVGSGEVEDDGAWWVIPIVLGGALVVVVIVIGLVGRAVFG